MIYSKKLGEAFVVHLLGFTQDIPGVWSNRADQVYDLHNEACLKNSGESWDCYWDKKKCSYLSGQIEMLGKHHGGIKSHV